MSFKNEEKWVPGELTQKGENNRRLRLSMYSSVRDRQVSITLRSTLYARYQDLREIVLLVECKAMVLYVHLYIGSKMHCLQYK